ncbi:MAG: zinc-binding dehydrogenase [Actinobacteria bacterium]|nr:zinc-binding dehydrogenase [Actinomycetota bacterium]
MSKKMLALRKVKRGKGNIELCEVPIPEIKPYEVLMKVWAAGVCGSDLLIEEDKHFYKAPVTLAHEFCGVAYKVGKDVKKIKEGDRIVGDIETESGWLGVTRDGAYAPFMSMPEKVCYKIPDDFNMDHAAMTELVTAIVHIMQERTNVKAGDFVVVIGPGPMGLLGVQFAKIRGASKVALIGLKKDKKRLEVGVKLGADYIFYSDENPEKNIMELTEGRGADFVLEAAGARVGQNIVGAQHAIDCARRAYEGPGGKGQAAFISLWGEPITLNFDQVCLGQLDIHGSWSWNGSETWRRAVNLITQNYFNLSLMITGRYSLEQWKEAFKNLRDGKDIKALIYPNGTGWL